MESFVERQRKREKESKEWTNSTYSRSSAARSSNVPGGIVLIRLADKRLRTVTESTVVAAVTPALISRNATYTGAGH